MIGDDFVTKICLPNLFKEKFSLKKVKMIINCFRKFQEVTKPVDWPKGIYKINLEDVTISAVVIIEGLVNKIENLCT